MIKTDSSESVFYWSKQYKSEANTDFHLIKWLEHHQCLYSSLAHTGLSKLKREWGVVQIFGKSSSINVRKVLWTCAEIGISYEHVEYGSGTVNSTQGQEFLAMNPNAMVPVLRDEFGTLWESNTICRYLAARYERSDLLPIDPMARAQVEKWMDWQASDLNSAWRYVFMGLVRQHSHFQEQEKLLDSATQWNRLMSILDQHLQTKGPYAVGKQFTLADVVLGVSINRWRSSPIEHAQLKYVDAYFDLLCERPAFLQFGANGIP